MNAFEVSLPFDKNWSKSEALEVIKLNRNHIRSILQRGEKMSELALIHEDGIEKSEELIMAALPILREKYSTVHDAETEEGYAENKTCARELQKYRAAVTKAHQSAKAPIIASGKKIDGLKKMAVPVIKELEDKYKNANLEVDERREREADEKAMKEKARIDYISHTIKDIQETPVRMMGENSQVVRDRMEALIEDQECEWADELRLKAQETLQETLSRLGQMVDFKQQQEDHAAKVAKEESALAEKKRIAEEEDRKEQAEIARKNKIEADKLYADRQKFEAEKAAEQKRLNDEKIRVESERRADEERKRLTKIEEDLKAQAEKEEKSRKAKEEANQIHRATIENEIINQLVETHGLDKAQAISIVFDISEGDFPLLSINY